MHDYLTKEGLKKIAANYREQQRRALADAERAAGAAMAIEYLIQETHDAPPAAPRLAAPDSAPALNGEHQH